MTSTKNNTIAPALPFTMKADALWGYSYKRWILPVVVIYVLALVVLYLFVNEYVYLFGGLLMLGILQLAGIVTYLSKTKKITAFSDRIEIKDGSRSYTLPYAKMDIVKRGLAYAGGRAFTGMLLSSKELGVSYIVKSLWWSIHDIRLLYAAIPADLRGDEADVHGSIIESK